MKIFYNGIERELREVLIEKGKLDDYQTIYQRIYTGNWEADEAIDTPVRKKVTREVLTEKQEDKLEELQIARKQNNASKLEVNRLDTRVARIENAYELIANQIKVLAPPKFNVIPIKEEQGKYILCLADLHIGSRFAHFSNEYSFEIAKERLNKVVNYIASKEIDELVVTNAGDVIQNILRISDIRLNESTVVQSVVQAMMILSEFINKLSKYVNKLDYYGVFGGNHDNIRHFGDRSFVSESLCMIITEYMKTALKDNDRVTIHTNYIEETQQFKVGECEVCLIHGNSLGRGQFEKGIQIYNGKYKKQFNLLIAGHLHSLKFAQVGIEEFMVQVPSLVGSCDYSRSLNVDSPSGVLLLEIRGRNVSEVKNIILN